MKLFTTCEHIKPSAERQSRLLSAIGSLKDDGHFITVMEHCPACFANEFALFVHEHGKAGMTNEEIVQELAKVWSPNT
jgi:hypothetical protein